MGKNFKLGITSLGILTFGYFLTYPFFDVYTNRIITKNFSEDSTNVPEVNERDFVTQFQEYVKENRSNLLKDYKNRKKIVNSNLLKQHMSGNKLIGGNPEWDGYSDKKIDITTEINDVKISQDVRNLLNFEQTWNNPDTVGITDYYKNSLKQKPDVNEVTIPVRRGAFLRDFNLGASPSGYKNQYDDIVPIIPWEDALKSYFLEEKKATYDWLSPIKNSLKSGKDPTIFQINYDKKKIIGNYLEGFSIELPNSPINHEVLVESGFTHIGNELGHMNSGHATFHGQIEKTEDTAISPAIKKVTFAGNFLPQYYDLYTEAQTAATYYFGTNWTSTLYTDEDIPFDYFLTVNPLDLFQITDIGKDEAGANAGKFWTKSNINKDLLEGALGYYYNSAPGGFLNAPTAKDAQGNYSGSAPLWTNDIAAYENETKDDHTCDIYLGGTNYGKATGKQDQQGGQKYWIDEMDIQGGRTSEAYQDFFNPENGIGLVAFLKNWSDTARWDSDNNNDSLISWENYFQFRDWVRNFAHNNKRVPKFTPTGADILAARAAISSKGEACGNTWIHNATKYNLTSSSLNNLALSIPALNLSEWDSNQNSDTWDNDKQQILEGQENNSEANVIAFSNLMKDVDMSNSDKNFINKHYLFNLPTNDDDINMTAGWTVDSDKNPWSSDDPNELNGVESLNTQNPNANYVGTSTTDKYNQGSSNIGDLNARSMGAIKEKEQTYIISTGGERKTPGFSFPKTAKMLYTIHDAAIKDLQKTSVLSFHDKSSFYDTDTPNVKFSGYDSEKQTVNLNDATYLQDINNPDNQPYQLLPIGQIIKNVKRDNPTLDNDYAILKKIYWDYKNNCAAIPIAEVNVYDKSDIDYAPTNVILQMIPDDANGILKINVLNASTNSLIFSDIEKNFETTTDPIVPIVDNDVKPNTVWIIIGSCVGAVIVGGVVGLWIVNKRKSTRGMNPDAKKLKKLGEFED